MQLLFEEGEALHSGALIVYGTKLKINVLFWTKILFPITEEK